jgi:DNA-directed RNA polymerase I subunit RPA2
VPVMMILNALEETNDKAIFDNITAGRGEEPFLAERVEGLLRTFKSYHLYTQRETLAYLGDKFRVVLDEAEDLTDEQVGEIFLHRIILVHLDSNTDKFRLLMYITRSSLTQIYDTKTLCSSRRGLCRG